MSSGLPPARATAHGTLVAVGAKAAPEDRLTFVDPGSGLPYGQIPWRMSGVPGLLTVESGGRAIDTPISRATDNVAVTNHTWSLTDQGTDVWLYGANVSHRFVTPGVYVATLNVSDAAGLESYLAIIKDVEAHARKAFEQGTPSAEAAAEYAIPDSLGEWMMFSPDYFERAFAAWQKELGGGDGSGVARRS